MAHNDVVDTIAAALAPFIGEHMARAATRDQCRKLGLREGPLDEGQVETLLARMGGGLNLFVGREQATRLVERVRSHLGGDGGLG